MLSIVRGFTITAFVGLTALCQVAVAAVVHPKSIKPEPLFERNVGQHPDHILYRGRLPHFDAGLKVDGSLELVRRPARGEQRVRSRVQIAPAGGLAPAQVRAEQPSDFRTNYFLRSSEQAKDFVDVPHFGRVVYRSVYEGIDLAYHFGEGRLEFDFVVAPRVDPSVIALEIHGAADLRIDDSGDLLIGVDGEVIRHRRPVAFQILDGRRWPVLCHYRLEGSRVTFALGKYDKHAELIIDPVVEYASYLGGAEADDAYAVKIGPGGFIYVTGETWSAKFPTLNAYDSGLSGTDVYITKINPATGKLVYSTYLGGGSSDKPTDIAVDSNGSAYVVGTAMTRFPTTNGAYQTGASVDGFITKLTPAGNGLAYSTFLFGTTPRAIAIDSANLAVVTGKAGTAFRTQNAFQATYGGNAGSSSLREGDAFVVKMNATGTGVVFATYLGGPNGGDVGEAIALDPQGRIVMAGSLSAPNNVPMVRPYLTTQGGGILVALSADGASVQYSTTFPIEFRGLAIDPHGNLVTVGLARTSTVPMVNPALGPGELLPSGGFVGVIKPVIAKFALGENLQLLFSSYYGSRMDCCEEPTNVAVDDMGDMYAVLTVEGSQFGALTEVNPFMSKAYIQGQIPDLRFEAVVAVGFPRDGGRALLFQTLLTPCSDFGSCYGRPSISARGVGQVAVAGTTEYAGFPISALNHQAAVAMLSGFPSADTFVMTIAGENPPLTVEAIPQPSLPGQFVLKAKSYQAGLVSGTVQFKNGGSVITSATMSQGLATSAPVTLPVGVVRLTATIGSTSSRMTLLPMPAVQEVCQ